MVLVPVGENDQDGLHAEQRIAKDPRFSLQKYYAPSGTRESCITCAIVLHNAHDIPSPRTSQYWITGPSYHSLGVQDVSADAAGEILAQGISDLIEAGTCFSPFSKTRDAQTDKRAADSDSDLSDSEIATLPAKWDAL